MVSVELAVIAATVVPHDPAPMTAIFLIDGTVIGYPCTSL
jgi:hypothetical protein